MIGTLTKLEVAKRQLVTAIRLLFSNEDKVSIYSLAANSWEIIDERCKLQQVESFSNQIRKNIPVQKDLKFDFINKPYRNFFKHADKDPYGEIPDLSDGTVDSLIYAAADDYLRLLRKAPVEFQVFSLWYWSIYPEKITESKLNEVFSSIEVVFPGMESLSRKERLYCGQKALEHYRLDPEIIGDPKTEV